MIALLLILSCVSDTEAGRAALDAHDLAGAELAYRRALAQDPDDSVALAGLGWTYLLANQVGASSGTFERCTQVAPQEAECLRGLASVALAQNNGLRARALLLQAQQLAPEDPKVLSSMALMELYNGEISSAEERYRQLMRRYPESAEYQLGLAQVLFRKSAYEEVLQVTEAALAMPIPQVRYRAMLWVIHAQALLANTAGREDPARCAETAPPVRAWLQAAEQALDNAEATGVQPPALVMVRRQIAGRRASLQEVCPPSLDGDG